MKKLLFAALFACMALGLSAQNPVLRKVHDLDPFARRFTLGVEVGIGESSHWYTEGAFTGKSRFANTLGLSGYLRLSDQWFVIAQPQYEWRRTMDYGNFRSSNLVVPVSIAASFRVPNRHTQAANRMFFAFGPYYGYTLSGKADGQKLDFNYPWNRHEVGFQANISYFIGRWGLGITAREGGSNMLKSKTRPGDPRDYNMVNQSAMFSLSFMF